MTFIERLVPFPHIQSIDLLDLFRYWSKFDRKGKDECWLWKASLMECGYGKMSLKGQEYYSNRVAWFLEKRQDPGMYLVMHECNNRACVNINHLSLGDHSANLIHRHKTNDSYQGELHPLSKLTEKDVRDIRTSKLKPTQLSRIYNVNPSTIFDVLNYRNWKHVS